MLKIGDLIKLLSGQSLQMQPVILTFINFLQNSYRQDEAFTSDLVQNFLNECMEYPHWQQNRESLTTELQKALATTISAFFDLRQLQVLKWPKDTQVIELESVTDQAELVTNFLKSQEKNTDKIRVVYDPNSKRTLGFVLAEDGSITIYSFNNKYVLRKGHLEPLRTDVCLKYDKNLELLNGAIQKLEIAPYVYARFIIDDALAFGGVARGYVFQKIQELKGQPLENYPKVFFALKRIEQFFIKKDSDPYYIQLIQSLEKSILAIKLDSDQALENSVDLMVRAQNATEHVFVGDKLLQLLIRDLQLLLENKTLPAPSPSKTSQNPETEFPWRTQQLDLIN